MAQVTRDQHFVPRFYLRRFSRDGDLQVLNLQRRRIGKRRRYTSVCYASFFYGAETGVEDDISQDFEKVFGALETQVADRFDGIIDRARACDMTDSDFDVLAFFMSLQWLRTGYFRARLQRMEENMLKQVMGIISNFPGFENQLRDIAAEEGKTITDEEIAATREFFDRGEYDLKTNNASHLNFISAEQIKGFHNLLLAKQWNIIAPAGHFEFVTSDNPVAEWIPHTGTYGASFFQRKHYLPLTPDLLIETVHPDEMRPVGVMPTATAKYVETDDDGVLMFDMVIAHHALSVRVRARTS